MKLSQITLLLAILVVSYSCERKQSTIAPELKDLTEAVYASGNIYPKDEYLVFANADGLLFKSYIEAGDEVHKDQPLFRIESDIQNIRYRTSEEIYQTAVANYGPKSPVLAEARAQLENARVKLQNDSINFIRFLKLWENNATAKIEYDRAKLAYDLSKNDYQARKNQLDRLKNQLYVDLQNAESQLKLTGKDSENTYLKALFKGVVYEVFKKEGEAVRRNEAVALVGNPDKTYLRLSVDELDIARIKAGQEVLVKVDLFKDTLFTAKVTRVHKKMNQQDQSFRVDAEFTGPQPPAFYGLNVEANIIIQKKSKVLTIPKSALKGADSVIVLTEEGEEKIWIMKGIEDFDYVEILKGLDTSSRIVGRQ